ncbi:MAG: HAD family phosphatase [Nitrospirae bacterium]|nr:HAD family phosphatase [Nitrospirota bacterium]
MASASREHLDQGQQMNMFLNDFRAVIFDMDGLLLDTEKIAMSAFLESCKVYGYDPEIAIYLKCIGTNAPRTREILLEGYGEKFPFEEISKIWSQKYKKALFEDTIPLKPGVREILRTVKKSGLKMAVATSTKYSTAMEKLKKTELHSFFSVVVGGDQVKKSKPDPEIYLKVANLISEPAKHCLVFEDSDNGVLSAHRAGMQVIQIPDLKAPSSEISKLGHLTVSSFHAVQALIENKESLSGIKF